MFYMHHPTNRIVDITAFAALAGTQNDLMGPSIGINPSGSGVTESLFGGGGGKGTDLQLGGGQEDGSAMIYCAQSKVKWGGGQWCEWGGGGMPPRAPRSYATAERTLYQ